VVYLRAARTRSIVTARLLRVRRAGKYKLDRLLHPKSMFHGKQWLAAVADKAGKSARSAPTAMLWRPPDSRSESAPRGPFPVESGDVEADRRNY